MVTDGFVPSHKAHVTNLAFAEVPKGPFRFPVIVVAELLAALPGEEQDKGVVLWGADTALTLTAELVVEISPGIDVPLLEHLKPPTLAARRRLWDQARYRPRSCDPASPRL